VEAPPELYIRPAEAGDVAFIMATWLRGVHHGSTIGRRIPAGIFFPEHHRVVELILARPGTHTLVASLTDAPDVIVGYLVFELATPTLVHWCHVKQQFRRMGVASRLLGSSLLPDKLKGVQVSHVSDDWFAFWRRSFEDPPFNPYRW
jgi:hypothetical protein